MNNKNNYQIMSKVVELIEEHLDIEAIQQSEQGTELAISKSYKIAENQLLSHLEKEVRGIDSITDLINCFYDSCRGFALLGMRANLIEESLIGPRKRESTILKDAVNKDLYSNQWNYLSLGDPLTEINEFTADNNYRNQYIPSISDKRSLAAMILLDYVLKGNYEGLNIGSALYDLTYSSCISPLFKDYWGKRSIVGFYDDEHNFNLKNINKGFIALFSNTLNSLLNRENSLLALQIKQYLHDFVVTAWSDYNPIDALGVYIEVETLITKVKAKETITLEFVEQLQYRKGFTLIKHYDTNIVEYKLDLQGLQSLATMLDKLGLSELQEVSHYINLVKSISE